jgi:aminopeptidase YwaD
MTRFLLSLAVASVALQGPASSYSAAENPDAERVRADVARLASDEWQGRRAGTQGADQAADWLAAEFRRIGLRPAGDGATYFQKFSFIDGVTLGSGNRLSTAGDSGRRDWVPGTDFRPLAFSSPGQVRGAVVFAGYGIVAKDLDYDDYAGVDAKDKVVLVLRYGPGGDDTLSKWAAFTALRMKVSVARDHGAKAVLVVTGPGTREAADALVPLRSDAALADAGIPAFSVLRGVAEALFAGAGTTLEAAQARIDATSRPAPLALADVRVEATADLTPRRSETRNVIGILGSGEAEALVVGAHYDHLGLGMTGSLEPQPDGKIHHGADDNASGVAGLLELARRFQGRPTPRRSLIFVAFGAEEEGTLGSSHFVKAPPLPFDRIAAMFNMDMIGRLRADTLDLHGVGTSPAWKPLVEEANRGVGLKLRFHEGGFGPSDHSPFYAAKKPVLFAFTGSHSDYHRPSDTAEKIDAAGILKVVGLLGPIIAAVADAPAPPAFSQVKAEQEQGAGTPRGFRVWVGGIPDYSEEGIGVKFSGVSPGSPAEKAGIQAGDVLVRFGPKEIRNIYDYTYALGEHKAGEAIVIEVRRGGQAVKLELILGSRPSATH